MRILIINPNATSSMTGEILAAGKRVASPGTELAALTAAQGPEAIESYVDEAFAAVEVMKLIASHRGFDGYVIACANDPGLSGARELTAAPVIGIGEAAFLQACLLAPTFAVLTTLKRAEQQVWHQLDAYGLRNRCVAVLATEVPVLATAAGGDAFLEAMRVGGRKAADEHGAEAIVLGCAGMVEAAQRLAKELTMPVIDGVAAAVAMVEGLVRGGQSTSKRATYAPPVDVAYKGLERPF